MVMGALIQRAGTALPDLELKRFAEYYLKGLYGIENAIRDLEIDIPKAVR